MKNFELKGYYNDDNRAALRNHVAVIGLSPFCSRVVLMISEQVHGTVPLAQNHGRNEIGTNLKRFENSMLNIALNPNISSVLLVGYEPRTTEKYIESFRKRSRKPIESVMILKSGGTIETVRDGSRKALELVLNASEMEREPMGLDGLSFGVKCGGSDATSGIASNPAVGWVSDYIVENGGTVIFSESTEIIGAEHILQKRARNEEVARKILEAARSNEAIALSEGIDLVGINPVPDNIEGGISTIEEKSLGAISKSGTSQINGVLEYAEIPNGKGLYFMDSPSGAHEVQTALAAAGVNMILFSTGTGNTSGGPGITPVLKITGNIKTVRSMGDHIDIDVSGIITGEMNVEEAGIKLLNGIRKVANGKLTRGEILRTWDFSPIPTGL